MNSSTTLVVLLLIIIIVQQSYNTILNLTGSSSTSAFSAGCTLSLGQKSSSKEDNSPPSLPTTSSRPPSTSKVGLCAIVKDVSRYLDEWADYNLLALEFTELFLYDNNDDFVLEAWAEQRRRLSNQKVTAIHAPGRDEIQEEVYNKCMRQFGSRVDYMAFFDDDEFLVLRQHDRVADFLDDTLIPGSSLSINWRIFGSANKTDYAPLPVTYRYQYRRPEVAPNVKVIVRPQDWERMLTAHSVKLKPKQSPPRSGWRDTSKQIRNFTKNGVLNEARPDDVAVLHHYKYKSAQEWYWKSCIRKDVSTPQNSATRNCKDTLHVGKEHDDRAWEFLKKKVPKYALFEQFEDYAQE
uniref:Glycosyltransferase family 92 protein n=1 Tax=Grammatophora oceanica TaxID=210454 RepID=A0A7S1UYJ2_9STRA